MIEETIGLLLQPLIVIAQFKIMIQFILQTTDIINNIFVITDKTKTDLKRVQIQKAYKTVDYLPLQ